MYLSVGGWMEQLGVRMLHQLIDEEPDEGFTLALRIAGALGSEEYVSALKEERERAK